MFILRENLTFVFILSNVELQNLDTTHEQSSFQCGINCPFKLDFLGNLNSRYLTTALCASLDLMQYFPNHFLSMQIEITWKWK